jgi:hypothetical protein
MHRVPPTTDRLSGNSLDESFIQILADEKGTAGAANAHEPTDWLRHELERPA